MTIPRLPEFFTPLPVVKTGQGVGKYIGLAMMAAMLSASFEKLPRYFLPENFHWFYSIVLPHGAPITLAAVLDERYSRIAIAVLSAVLFYQFYGIWIELEP